MKKVLMGILCLSVVALGYDNTSPSNVPVPETLVKVTAQVVEPLKIETNNVDFGVVGKGTSGNVPKTNGEIKISGDATSKVEINFSVDNNNHYATYPTSGLTVTLNATAASATMPVDIKVNNGTAIPTTITGGSITMPVTGTLNVPAGQSTGTYEGKFYVNVKYVD